MKFTISACQYLVMSLISSPNNSLPSAQSSIAYLQNNVPWSLEFRDWAFFHGNLEGFMEDDCPHCALSSSHFWFWGLWSVEECYDGEGENMAFIAKSVCLWAWWSSFLAVHGTMTTPCVNDSRG